MLCWPVPCRAVLLHADAVLGARAVIHLAESFSSCDVLIISAPL